MVMLRFETDGSVRVLSIPRDLWDDGAQRRIGTSYENGVQALLDRVTGVTGIPIDHYIGLDFPGLVRIVDDLGGLPLAVDADLRDDRSGLDLGASACRTLSGKATLALLRSRHLEYRDATGTWAGAEFGDGGRMARLQAVLRAAVDAVAKTGADPVTIDRLTRVLADHATLDDDLTLPRLAGLGKRLVAAGRDRTATRTVPVEPATRPDGGDVLELAPGARALFQEFGAPARTEPAPAAPPVGDPEPVLVHSC